MKNGDIPTANEMSKQLVLLNRSLYENKLIQPDSQSPFNEAIRELKGFGTQRTWQYTIDASTPIEFVPTSDKKLGKIVPQVYLDIAVEPPKRNDLPPFKRLDTKIEIFDLKGKLQSRWHIDLANRKEDGSYQEGPLFHLQSGGHKPESKREDELKISRPRWAMPPMELILTCEMILANFYPEPWKIIRNEKRWLKLIHIAQLMCYSAYCQRMQNCLFQQQPLIPKKQSDSVLTEFWASEWGL